MVLVDFKCLLADAGPFTCCSACLGEGLVYNWSNQLCHTADTSNEIETMDATVAAAHMTLPALEDIARAAT